MDTQQGATIYKGGRFSADPWSHLADDAPVPAAGYAILPLKRWLADAATLARHPGPLGLALGPADPLELDAATLARFAVIAIAFPKFSDGRGYSTARRLRDRLQFKGELRATGDVLLDQVPLMLRLGFDALEIIDRATRAALERGHRFAITEVYQAPRRGRADASPRQRAREVAAVGL